MGADGFGSSVIIAVAALVWITYLVPTWLRRREYMATERNALRLQQTLRIMAETAEIPEQVRLEASARSAVIQERALKKRLIQEAAIDRAQHAALARASARRLIENRPAIAADIASGSLAAARLRRSRATVSLFLLVGSAVLIAGIIQSMQSGSVAGSVPLLAGGAGVALASGGILARIAAVVRARKARASAIRSRLPVRAIRIPEVAVAAAVTPVVRETWTPVAVPKPLYMTRPAPERAHVASLDAAAELRQAAVDSERRLREALASPEVTPLRPPTENQPVFARMGFVGELPEARADISEALRRRRSAAS